VAGSEELAALGLRLRGLGLDLDPAKVSAVEQLNESLLYGAILLARYPTTGAAAAPLAAWEHELDAIIPAKVRFNPNMHMAEASLTDPPHLPHSIRMADIAHVDFDRLLRVTLAAAPFTIRFVSIYLDPDGNLVLAGRMDGPEVVELRQRWREAGLWVKGHPVLAGAQCTFHATMTHVPLGTWRGMKDVALGRLRAWLDAHAALDRPVDVEVRGLQIVCMPCRSGRSTLGDDIDLPLQQDGRILDGSRVAQEILRRFDSARLATAHG